MFSAKFRASRGAWDIFWRTFKQHFHLLRENGVHRFLQHRQLKLAEKSLVHTTFDFASRRHLRGCPAFLSREWSSYAPVARIFARLGCVFIAQMVLAKCNPPMLVSVTLDFYAALLAQKYACENVTPRWWYRLHSICLRCFLRTNMPAEM